MELPVDMTMVAPMWQNLPRLALDAVGPSKSSTKSYLRMVIMNEIETTQIFLLRYANETGRNPNRIILLGKWKLM